MGGEEGSKEERRGRKIDDAPMGHRGLAGGVLGDPVKRCVTWSNQEAARV